MHPRGATSAATASAPAATVCASSNRLRQQQGYTSSQLAMRHLFSPPATWTRAALTRPLNAKPTLPTWAQSLRQGFLSQTASTLSPRRFMPSRVGFPTTHSERSPGPSLGPGLALLFRSFARRSFLVFLSGSSHGDGLVF